MVTDLPPVPAHVSEWSPAAVKALVLKVFPTATERKAVRVAWCESRLRPHVTNPSGAAGVYQFMPGTWRASWNPWRARSPYNPTLNVKAAFVLSRGGVDWRHWNCG